MIKENKEKLEQYDYAWDNDETIFKKEPEYSKAIGELFIAFANLESVLNILIAEGISNRSHDLGYLIIKNLTYNNKVKLAKDLYSPMISSISSKKTRDRRENEFKRIYMKLLDMGTFRNKIAHANWMTLDKRNYVRTHIGQDDFGFITFIKIKITPEMMLKYAAQCRLIASWTLGFTNKVSI